MPSPLSFEDTVNGLISAFREKLQGGLTWSEFLALLHMFVAAVMAAAEQLAQAGPTKKQMVLDAVGKLFDMIAPQVPLPGPIWLVAMIEPFRPLIRPIIRAIVLKSADGILEGIFRLNFKPQSLAVAA